MAEAATAPATEQAYVAQATTAYRFLKVGVACGMVGVAALLTGVGIDVATWSAHHSALLQTVDREAFATGITFTASGVAAAAGTVLGMREYEKGHGFEVGRFHRAMERTGDLSAL